MRIVSWFTIQVMMAECGPIVIDPGYHVSWSIQGWREWSTLAYRMVDVTRWTCWSPVGWCLNWLRDNSMLVNWLTTVSYGYHRLKQHCAWLNLESPAISVFGMITDKTRGTTRGPVILPTIWWAKFPSSVWHRRHRAHHRMVLAAAGCVTEVVAIWLLLLLPLPLFILIDDWWSIHCSPSLPVWCLLNLNTYECLLNLNNILFQWDWWLQEFYNICSSILVDDGF